MAVPSLPSQHGSNPQYSQTPQQGFVPNIVSPNDPNSGGFAQPANRPTWIDSMVRYYAWRWANGQRGNMPVGLDVSQLDPTDGPSGNGASTLYILARYFQNYQGQDPTINSSYPEPPPGPQDNIEDPAVTAARIADQEFNKNFDEDQRQFNITTSDTEKRDAQVAFNDAFQNELKIYAQQAGIWTTQTKNALDAYNYASENYRQNETNISGNLQHAGTLAEQLQTLEDARTKEAIALKADPRNYVEQTYATRALQAPTGTSTPAFQNVDALTEVIRRLIDYHPQTPPQAPATPVGAPPIAPNQQTFQLPPGMGQNQPPPATHTTPPPAGNVPQAPPVQNNLVPGATPTTGQLAHDFPGSYMLNGVLHDAQGHYSTDNGVNWTQDNGQATPQYSNQSAANALSGVTGTMHNPAGDQPYSPGPGQTAYYDKYTGTYGPNKPPDRVPGLAQGTNELGTVARQMIVGDTQRPGVPNPEMVKVRNPGKNTRIVVVPLSSVVRGPKYAKGTPRYATGTDPNNPTLTSYSDQDIQNQPYLQYMQGNNQDTFRNIASGYATGANGQRVPEAGSFNVWRYSQLSPLEQAMLTSDYKSANRDLASTIALAKARAPYGTAVNTSMIKT